MSHSIEQSNAAVVQAFNRVWASGDIEAALDLCTPDFVYMLHLDADVVEHAGCWVGRDEVRTALTLMRKNFEFQRYEPTILGAQGETVRQMIDWQGIHKASGRQLSMRFRHVIIVRNGRMLQVEEFHDAAQLRAFMAMCSDKAGD